MAVIPQIGESTSPRLPRECGGETPACVSAPVIAPSSARRALFLTPFDYPYLLPAGRRHASVTATTLIALCSNGESASDLTRPRRRINSPGLLIRVGSERLLFSRQILPRLSTLREIHRYTSREFSDNTFMNFFVIIQKTTRSNRLPLSFDAILPSSKAVTRVYFLQPQLAPFSAFLEATGNPNRHGFEVPTPGCDLLRYAPLGILQNSDGGLANQYLR